MGKLRDMNNSNGKFKDINITNGNISVDTKIAKPTESQNYPKLEIRLEETNFVRRYYDFCSSMNDAYPEYHHAGALTLLSVAADRKVFIKLKNGTHFTNIWSLCLGQSTTSRKSTALRTVTEILDDKCRDWRMPTQVTPESFIEVMSINPHCYLSNDECAGLLKGINRKPYMADLRDTLCLVYDCSPFSRKLRTNNRDKTAKTEFNVNDPYLTIEFATTFESLANSATEDDFNSGLLCRYLTYYPEYIKEIKGVEDETKEDESKKDLLIQQYDRIFDSISNVHSIRMRMSENGKKIYNDWLTETETKLMHNRDEVLSSVFGRYQVYVLKLAMLYTIGSDNFQNHLNECEIGPIVEYTIPDDYITEAIREIDTYFIPTMVAVREKITNQGSDNLMGKILEILKKSGQLTHSQLMQRCNLGRMNKTSVQFNQAINTLEEMDMISVTSSSATNANSKAKNNAKLYKLNT